MYKSYIGTFIRFVRSSHQITRISVDRLKAAMVVQLQETLFSIPIRAKERNLYSVLHLKYISVQLLYTKYRLTEKGLLDRVYRHLRLSDCGLGLATVIRLLSY